MDCIAFLQWALPQLSLSWRGFRKVRGQVCKRIRRRAESLGLEGLATYRDYLDRHHQEWAILDGFCRITISSFYRDQNVFRLLGEHVLPQLAQQAAKENGNVTCWSAGCASGEEVYTLKILWDLSIPEDYSHVAFPLLGTDIDEAVLARASTGCYQEGSLKEIPSGWIERCFEWRDNHLCIKSEHRQNVSFLRQDIRRHMPGGPFDLVLCRNLVLTYFERPLQTYVLRNLTERLKCGGYLVIGAHEAMPESVTGFQPLSRCRAILCRQGSPASFERVA